MRWLAFVEKRIATDPCRVLLQHQSLLQDVIVHLN